MKIPILVGELRADGSIEADPDNERLVTHLEMEKQIYERLRHVPGVAECIESTSNGILLTYYPNGAMSEYLARCTEAPLATQRMEWILQATDTIARCHQRGVLIFDIALRNFLLADDLTLRLIDFSNSSLLPPDTNIVEANADGCTVQVDLLHLSSVIYSICTWRAFSVSCNTHSEWPDLEQMPDLSRLDLGPMIQNCWERKYTSAEELLQDLRLCTNSSVPQEPPSGT